MADFLRTGVSGLLAFQRALDVTSQNISNIATEGYSRQRAQMSTRNPQPYGNGWVGSGVQVDTITRSYDEFLAGQVRTSGSSYQRLATLATLTERVDNMFASSKTGLSASLESFKNAIQEVASTPTSTSARQVLLSQAQNLASRFESYNEQLGALDREVESRVKSEVSEINALAQGIAQLNTQIKNGYAQNGQPPNDLLDQRDKLIDKLSTHINVTLTDGGENTVNVAVGNGQSLVLGSKAATLSTTPDSYDPTRSHIVLSTTSGTVDITASVSGGTIGGLLDFRNQVLDPAHNSLGRMTVALAELVNKQNNAGIDQNGALGKDIFSVGGVQVLPQAGAAGTVSVTRSDLGGLTDSDYILQNNGGTWSMKNAATGASVPLTGSGTAADPFRADGLSIVVGGAAASGDKFMIRPTRGAAADFNVVMTNPSGIAAAAPVRVSQNTSNTGTGKITFGEVTAPGNAQLRSPVTIQFTSANTYTINGQGSFTYTDGQPISLNGYDVKITGAPAAGDTFSVGDNTSGTGDNTNALKLSALLQKSVLNGGTTSLNGAVDGFIGNIGVIANQAQVSRDAQEALYTESVDSRDAVSGVNLDEEAANLLRYQQAYQAAAQLISVANTLFQTLISATSRG